MAEAKGSDTRQGLLRSPKWGATVSGQGYTVWWAVAAGECKWHAKGRALRQGCQASFGQEVGQSSCGSSGRTVPEAGFMQVAWNWRSSAFSMVAAAAAAVMGRGAPDGFVLPRALPAVPRVFWVLMYEGRAIAHLGCLPGCPGFPLRHHVVLGRD